MDPKSDFGLTFTRFPLNINATRDYMNSQGILPVTAVSQENFESCEINRMSFLSRTFMPFLPSLTPFFSIFCFCPSLISVIDTDL